MELLNYLQGLSLWAMIPLFILGALLFVVCGPRDVLVSNFHGDYSETVWSCAPIALLGIGAAIFALLRVLGVVTVLIAHSFFGFSAAAKPAQNAEVTEIVPMSIASVRLSP